MVSRFENEQGDYTSESQSTAKKLSITERHAIAGKATVLVNADLSYIRNRLGRLKLLEWRSRLSE